jgi:hypothetical protein
MPFDSSYSKRLRGLSNYEHNTTKPHPRSLDIKDSKRALEHIPIQYTQGMWAGPISVGNPPVEFNVNFDTGSGSFFLATKACDNCLVLTPYDPVGSSTAVPLSRNFNIPYVDGTSASGKLYADTVTIGRLTATLQILGAASEWTKPQRTPSDGIMGLAFQSASTYNAIPVFQTLVNQRQTDYPLFAMKLVEGGAVLTLGGMNDDLFDGPITYVDVINRGWWEVKAQSLSVDGQVIFKGISCFIDSVRSN